jgi:hypothetical protein
MSGSLDDATFSIVSLQWNVVVERTLKEHQEQRQSKLTTIPFFAEYVPRHVVVHVCKTIETLLPLTKPVISDATQCLVAPGLSLCSKNT